MKLTELNVRKRIILSLLILMLLTILTAALASLGFLQAQNRIDDIGSTKLKKFKAASELVLISRKLEAKIRFLEGKRKTYEMDSVSYDVLQLLYNLEEAIKKLTVVGFTKQTIDSLNLQLAQLRSAVTDTNRHLRRGQQLQQKNKDMLQSLADLQTRLSQVEPSLATALFRDLQNIILRLQTAMASPEQQQIRELKAQINAELIRLSSSEELSSEARSLIANVRQVGLSDEGVFAFRFEQLVHNFAFESTVEMNIARLAPLLHYSQKIFDEVALGIDNAIEEQQFRLQMYLLVFATIVFVSVMVGLSLMENLKSHVIDRLLRLRKNMSRFVAGERDAKELALEDVTIEDDEIQDMSNDLASVVTTLNRRSRELEALSNFGRAMTQIKDRQEVYEQLNNNISNLIPVETVLLAIWDSKTMAFDYPVAICLTGKNSSTMISQTKRIVAELGQQEKEIHTTSKQEFSHFVDMNESLRQELILQSLAFYPIYNSNDEFLGALVVTAEQQDAFSANRLQALQTLSRYLTISLEFTDIVARLNDVENKLFLQERWAGLGSWNEQTGRVLVSRAHDLKFATMSVKQQHHALFEWLLEQPGMDDVELRKAIKKRLEVLYGEIDKAEQESRKLCKKLESLQNVATLPDTVQETDITPLLKDVINLVRHKFPKVEVQMVVARVAKLTCHPQRFSQALTDILLNACLSAQKQHGGIPKAGQVKVEIAKVEQYFVLSIINNGLRLTAAQAEQMLSDTDMVDIGMMGLGSSKAYIGKLDGVMSIDINHSQGYRVNVKLVP